MAKLETHIVSRPTMTGYDAQMMAVDRIEKALRTLNGFDIDHDQNINYARDMLLEAAAWIDAIERKKK